MKTANDFFYAYIFMVTNSIIKVTVIYMSDAVVKIDSNLLTRIKKIVKDREKKIRYRSSRQFVDIAVLDLLEKEGKNGVKSAS